VQQYRSCRESSFVDVKRASVRLSGIPAEALAISARVDKSNKGITTMKTNLMIGVATGALALMLAGCGGNAPDAAGAAEEAAAAAESAADAAVDAAGEAADAAGDAMESAGEAVAEGAEAAAEAVDEAVQ
jgi:hypothetical protein